MQSKVNEDSRRNTGSQTKHNLQVTGYSNQMRHRDSKKRKQKNIGVCVWEKWKRGKYSRCSSSGCRLPTLLHSDPRNSSGRLHFFDREVKRRLADATHHFLLENYNFVKDFRYRTVSQFRVDDMLPHFSYTLTTSYVSHSV